MGGDFLGALGTNTLLATEQYIIVATKLGGESGDDAYICVDNLLLTGPVSGDFNDDDKVDLKDYAMLADNWLSEQLFP